MEELVRSGWDREQGKLVLHSDPKRWKSLRTPSFSPLICRVMSVRASLGHAEEQEFADHRFPLPLKWLVPLDTVLL